MSSLHSKFDCRYNAYHQRSDDVEMEDDGCRRVLSGDALPVDAELQSVPVAKHSAQLATSANVTDGIEHGLLPMSNTRTTS